MKKKPDKATALITGASSGMGYEYAQQLAKMHYDLVLISNEEDKLKALALELQQKYNIKTWAFYTDLAQTAAANNVYEFCQNKNLEIDILINNAGMFFFGEVVKTQPELVLKKTLLHVVTPSVLCTLFGRDMKLRRRGYILNMSSISAYMPYPGIALYASTKAYLKSFSRALRSEMLDYNVSVTCVCPGAVATNLFDRDKINYKKAMRLGIMMKAETVVRIGIRAMFCRKAIVIPGILNRITVFLVRITPAGFILFIKRNSKLLPADK
jgi:uncharacterized protein